MQNIEKKLPFNNENNLIDNKLEEKFLYLNKSDTDKVIKIIKDFF